MSSALRFARLVNSGLVKASVTSSPGGSSILAKNSAAASALQQQCASMKSIARQIKEGDTSCQLQKPWPYKQRKYRKIMKWYPFLDPTYCRINENSKIVVVDGNMSSRKGELAQEIANRFGMLYMPEPTLDQLYINHQGFDYRTLNKYIAEGVQAVDDKMFYENPAHKGAPWWKLFYYRLRYIQYVDALAHLFNTGQGVVLERSVHSDFVFTDAMYDNGYLPQDAYDHYFRLRYDTIHKLYRPHLVIYADVPVDTCLKRIKEKNIPYQVNSKVLNADYLSSIEKSYKEKYLPDIEQYSSLLIYKWANPQPDDYDNMVLDIETVSQEMENFDIRGTKYKDWAFYWNEHWDEARYLFTSEKFMMIFTFNRTNSYDVDSVELDTNDAEHREEVFYSFVKNYGVYPFWDPSMVGTWKQYFAISNYWDRVNFMIRAPYY